MNNAIVPFTSFDELRQIGAVLAKSGFFQDSSDEAKAVVKVLAGRELGIGPIEAMTGINIVKGRVALSANLMAAQIKRHPDYDYRVTELTDQKCSIEFFQRGENLGVSTFTVEDAKRAGLIGKDTYRQYPRNLLFARAMSNGAKWYCPDAFAGPTYTPDELGAEVDGETGEIVQSTAVIIEDDAPAEQKQPDSPAQRAPAKTAPRRSARAPVQAGNGDGSEAGSEWHKRTDVIAAVRKNTGMEPPHIINRLKKGEREKRIKWGDNDTDVIAYATDPDSYSPPPADAPDAEPTAGDEVPFEQEGGELHKATQSQLDAIFDAPTEEQAKAAIEGA